MTAAEPGDPAPWLLTRLEELRQCAARGPIVDLACGRGRNALALARRGLPVVGVDRNPDLLRALVQAGRSASGALAALRADLETEHLLPFKTASCGAILVFRFLYRPLAPAIERALRPGGLLYYETFTTGQPEHGWGPRKPAFLLSPGELPALFPNLEVVHFDEEPRAASATTRGESSARLCARKPAAPD